MDLRRLTQNTGCRLLRGDALTEVTSVCCDSLCAGSGALFVCLPGRHADGHDFAAQAVTAGAAAVLCTHDVPGLPAGCAVLLAGVALQYERQIKAFLDHPSFASGSTPHSCRSTCPASIPRGGIRFLQA